MVLKQYDETNIVKPFLQTFYLFTFFCGKISYKVCCMYPVANVTHMFSDILCSCLICPHWVRKIQEH